MDKFITIARHMHGFGCALEEIRAKLLIEGATEEEVFLAYKAAEILNK